MCLTLPLLPVRAWCCSIASRHHLGSRDRIFTWLGNCHHGGLETPASRILRILFLSVETAELWYFEPLSPKTKSCHSSPPTGTRPGVCGGFGLSILETRKQVHQAAVPFASHFCHRSPESDSENGGMLTQEIKQA